MVIIVMGLIFVATRVVLAWITHIPISWWPPDGQTIFSAVIALIVGWFIAGAIPHRHHLD